MFAFLSAIIFLTLVLYPYMRVTFFKKIYKEVKVGGKINKNNCSKLN